MENTTRRWLIEAIVDTDLEKFSDHDPFSTRISIDEVRCGNIIGLPVLLNRNEQRQVGTIVASTLAYRTWRVTISVHISDFTIRQAQFMQLVVESPNRLNKIDYAFATRIVPDRDNLCMVMRKSWIKSFSFVETSTHVGSEIVSVHEQSRYNKFEYPMLKSLVH